MRPFCVTFRCPTRNNCSCFARQGSPTALGRQAVTLDRFPSTFTLTISILAVLAFGLAPLRSALRVPVGFHNLLPLFTYYSHTRQSFPVMSIPSYEGPGAGVSDEKTLALERAHSIGADLRARGGVARRRFDYLQRATPSIHPAGPPGGGRDPA